VGAQGAQLREHGAQLRALDDKVGAQGAQLREHGAQLRALDDKVGAQGAQLREHAAAAAAARAEREAAAERARAEEAAAREAAEAARRAAAGGENNMSPTHAAYHSLLLRLIGSGDVPGTITVTASSPGLTPSSVEVRTVEDVDLLQVRGPCTTVG
jgi:hypothetical protein